MNHPQTACCFTGHRNLPKNHLYALKRALPAAIEDCLEDGCFDFYCGGAVGFDTLAADTILHLRAQDPRIRLHLLLPHRHQADLFSPDDRIRYYDILSRADTVFFLSDTAVSGNMLRRNRALVNHSTRCISYCTRSSGGTAYTVAYAVSRGIPVYNLAEQISAWSIPPKR